MGNPKGREALVKALSRVAGLGPSLGEDLWKIGIRSLQELRESDPEELYARLEEITGKHQDRCVLYSFRCAVNDLRNPGADRESRLWWNWKEKEGRVKSLKELVLKNRSIRRFHGEREISREVLLDLVELARLTPSAANLQPLKYLLSWKRESNERIFPKLRWAAYLKDWQGPVEGERPSGYIVVLGDKRVSQNFGYDQGIVSQTLLLGAVEKGLGGCMIATEDREALRRECELPEHFEILLVIALGYPLEEVVLEPLGPEGSVKYWRDEKGVHHVPKRELKELLLFL